MIDRRLYYYGILGLEKTVRGKHVGKSLYRTKEMSPKVTGGLKDEGRDL